MIRIVLACLLICTSAMAANVNLERIVDLDDPQSISQLNETLRRLNEVDTDDDDDDFNSLTAETTLNDSDTILFYDAGTSSYLKTTLGSLKTHYGLPSDDKVKADSGDATADYLDGKVDDVSIEVTSDDVLALKGSVGIGTVSLAVVNDFISDATKDTDSTSWTKLKSIGVPATGTYTVAWTMRMVNPGTIFQRVYRNDVAHPDSTEYTQATETDEARSENLFFLTGDECQIWGKRGTGSPTCRASYFHLESDGRGRIGVILD